MMRQLGDEQQQTIPVPLDQGQAGETGTTAGLSNSSWSHRENTAAAGDTPVGRGRGRNTPGFSLPPTDPPAPPVGGSQLTREPGKQGSCRGQLAFLPDSTPTAHLPDTELRRGRGQGRVLRASQPREANPAWYPVACVATQ